MFCAAFLYLQFGFVILCRKEISTKAARKLLVKLTAGGADFALIIFEAFFSAHSLFLPLQKQCSSLIWISLTWLNFVICRLELISTTAQAASKNDACFKSSQN